MPPGLHLETAPSSVVNWCPHRQCDVRAFAVRPGEAPGGPKLAQFVPRQCVFVASTVCHIRVTGALDRVFSQVIDGLGGSGTATYQVVGNSLCLTSVNCLTLMPMPTVKFLTVLNGHVG